MKLFLIPKTTECPFNTLTHLHMMKSSHFCYSLQFH